MRRRPPQRLVALAAIVALGLALRLLEAYLCNADHPNSAARLTMGDEPGYDGLARSLLAGYGFDWPGRVPGYPLWVALWHAVTGFDYRVLTFAQAVLGTAAVPLTYVLGRRLLGTAAGLLAALGVAVDVVLVNQTGPVYSEVLYTPVLLVGMIALVAAVQRPTTRRMLLAGACIGAGALVRPMLLWFPLLAIVPLALVLARRDALRSWLAVLAGTAAVLAPWVTYTTLRWDALIPLQTSNAILWQGSPEYYRLVHEGDLSYMEIWCEVIYGPGWEAHDPTSVEGDAWGTRRALALIRDDPGTYLEYAAQKVVFFWTGDPQVDRGESHLFDHSRLRELGFTRVDAAGTWLSRVLPLLALLAVAGSGAAAGSCCPSTRSWSTPRCSPPRRTPRPGSASPSSRCSSSSSPARS